MKKLNLKSPVAILIISWIVGGFGHFITEPEFLRYGLQFISAALFIFAIVVYFRK